MTNHDSEIDQVLAVADILDHDVTLLDEVEGYLLLTAGRGDRISPAALARDTELSREAATDLFRQLEESKTIDRNRYDTELVESRFDVSPDRTRQLFTNVYEAIQLLEAHEKRVPRTTVTPLVTFPDDPAFDEVTSASFGMDSLLSTLASQVKRCDDEIVLLSPFFEGDGFGRLADVLLDALAQGVELTIVTRYLADSDSHNYHVIQSFMNRVATEGLTSGVTLVDYTVWDDDTPMTERSQDGENPAFTLHAKVMLFDSRAAYVGSANVTDYGFNRYLEMGVLLEGAKVASFSELCDYLLDSDGAVEVSM
jgi:putative cardiolipin synthase